DNRPTGGIVLVHAKHVVDVVLPETLVGILQGELRPEAIVEASIVPVRNGRVVLDAAGYHLWGKRIGAAGQPVQDRLVVNLVGAWGPPLAPWIKEQAVLGHRRPGAGTDEIQLPPVLIAARVGGPLEEGLAPVGGALGVSGK